MMKITLATLLLLSAVVPNCLGECHMHLRFSSSLYLASNRALQSHSFLNRTLSSRVVCARECFMNPDCASFNYHTSNHVCELNGASRNESLDGDFVELQGSVYSDDNVDTPSLSIPTSTVRYSSCRSLYVAGFRRSGINTIFPTGTSYALQVYCDMEIDGGGWVVFQRRQSGDVNFYRDWAEYQSGFGDPEGDFWLGNDALRDLTASGRWQLRVDMEDWEGSAVWARYGDFAISGEKYTLRIGSSDAQNTVGDAMTTHDGQPFTTKDQDNDGKTSMNCAQQYKGAWWFGSYCFHSHLNGEYYDRGNVPYGQGIQWDIWKGDDYSLKQCSMKIREVV